MTLSPVRLILFGGLIFGLSLFWYSGMWRYVITGWYILRVEPYQQLILDAPSILVVGDSTAYGTGAVRSSDSIAGRIGNWYPSYTVITKARNGLTTEQLAFRLHDWLVGADHALIVIQVGGNDILRAVPIEESMDNMALVLSQANTAAASVLWLSAGNVGGAPMFTGDPKRSAGLEQQSREFHAAAHELAQSLGVTYHHFFRERAEDVFLRYPKRYLARDGLHPSSAGYEVWFLDLLPVLEQLLPD